MRGRLSLVVSTAVASAMVLVVSLVATSSAGPNVTRLAFVERATTDTEVDLTANGDSTGDLLTFHNELFDGRMRTWSGPIRGTAFGSRWA